MLLVVGIIIGGMVAAAALAGIWMRDRARASGRPAARPCSILVPNERDCDNVAQHQCEDHFFLRGTTQYMCQFNTRLNRCVARHDGGEATLCPTQRVLNFAKRDTVVGDGREDRFDSESVSADAQRPCHNACEGGYACVRSMYDDAQEFPKRCELTMCEAPIDAAAKDADEFCGPGARCVTEIDGNGGSRCVRLCSTDDDCALRHSLADLWTSDVNGVTYSSSGNPEHAARRDYYNKRRASGLTCQTVEINSVEGRPHKQNMRFCLPRPTVMQDSFKILFNTNQSSVPSRRQ